MFVVGICDSHSGHRAVIKKCIEALFFETADLQTAEFSRAGDVMDAIASGTVRPDLVILDAGACGGLSLAHSMRSEGLQTDILVFTESAEFIRQGYRYHLFDYVLKSEAVAGLRESLLRYRRERLEAVAEFLSVRSNGCMQNIRLDKIRYFESRGRKIAAVADEERFEFYQKMDELMDVLPKGRFVRCHQSYSVNLRAVMSFSSAALVLRDGMEIPVSRKYYPELRAVLGRE